MMDFQTIMLLMIIFGMLVGTVVWAMYHAMNA
jgi:hypothetical protein